MSSGLTRNQAELSPMEVLTFLKKVSLFNHLELEDLVQLKEIAREVRFQSGETIITEGETGQTAFVIVDGLVEVFRKTPQGKKQLAVLEKNQVFGEMAIIENEPRSASVQAKRPSLILELSGPEFRERLQTDAFLSFRMLQGFSKRLRLLSSNLS